MTASFAAGASLVLAGSFAASSSFVSDKKRLIRHTEAVLGLISHVRTDIDHFLTPVGGLFEDFRNDDLESCGFSSILREKGLDAAVCSQTASLTEETQEILRCFSSALGRSYKEEQLRICDYCTVRISEELAREREKLKRDLGTYRFAPLIFALFIILCFL